MLGYAQVQLVRTPFDLPSLTATHTNCRLMFCLFASVWLAFAAAILDLVEALAISRGDDLSNSTNLALTISREISYALSFGLRNLWFWLYVACPPPAAPASEGSYVHSGSWHRWGIFGHMLKWTVLLSVIAIVALQTLYRVDTSLKMDGPVYDAEGTLQIILSFVFMLKLFLNIYLVALDSIRETWWRGTLLRYLPVFLALLINFGIALGNILQCESSTLFPLPDHVFTDKDMSQSFSQKQYLAASFKLSNSTSSFYSHWFPRSITFGIFG